MLLDCYGKPVAKILHDFSFFVPNFNVYKEDSKQLLFHVKGHLTWFKSKATTTVTNQTTQQPVNLVVKGNWAAKNAGIYIGEPKAGGIVIAHVHRPYNLQNLFTSRDQYLLSIAPGVDISLVVLLAVMFDEMAQENNKKDF